MVVIGLYLSRRASHSLDDYFLGGRKLPWWALGFTGMGAYVNIAGTLIIIAFVYMLGPAGMYIEFRGGACLVMAFMLLWTGKWHRRSGCMTQAEWMIFRFGKGIGAQFSRLFQVFAIIVLGVGLLALTIKGLGIFLSTFIPLEPWLCALIFVGLAALYTTMSGFYGVVFTDIVQGAMVLIGALLCAFIAFRDVPSVQALAETAREVTGNISWTSSKISTNAILQPGYEQYSNILKYAFSYLILNILLGLGITGAEPMYFGARNDRDCGRLTFLWIFTMTARWLLIMAIAVFGIYMVKNLFPSTSVTADATAVVKEYLPEVSSSQWQDAVTRITLKPDEYAPELISKIETLLGERWQFKLKMVSFNGGINPETIMSTVLSERIPPGLRGIILICLIAASMSTLDITMNKSAGFFVKDLYQAYIRPKAKNRELIFSSYGFTVLLVAAGFIMALSVKNVTEIWGWMVASLNAGLIAPALLRLYWWRFSGSAFAIGTGVGIVLSIVQRLYWTTLSEIESMIFVFGGTVLVTVIVSFIFKPAPKDVLTRFYNKTKPFGLWGPLRKELSPEVRKKMNKEHRNDIIAVPFVMGWQITMFLMAMQIVMHAWDSFFITMGISLICISGLYWFWYRNLPKENVWPEEETIETQN